MVESFAEGVIKSMALEFPWEKYEQKAKNLGFLQMGWALLTPIEDAEGIKRYRQWLSEENHGEMEYLKRHLPIKENPELLKAGLKSAFVFAFPYFPHPAPLASVNQEQPLRIALYAEGADYHHWLQAKLEEIQKDLQLEFPGEIFLSATDSKPVLERDLAHRAGLGWFGKNTCLIDRKHGSLFLIGEILTSLELAKKIELSQDFCGTCTRCIDVCPTGALEEPRKLNANKCISYLTIESPTNPPENLRAKIGDWFFGCDLCQTVCPWNQKIFKEKLEVLPTRGLTFQQRQALTTELGQILKLSGKQLLKKYTGSPLSRAGHRGLRRNAMLVIANLKIQGLNSEIEAWKNDENLREIAQWTLASLNQK
jgi:epoxyqueuosine reductase